MICAPAPALHNANKESSACEGGKRFFKKKIECVREGTCFSSPVNFAVVSAAVAFLGNVKGKEIKKAETPK